MDFTEYIKPELLVLVPVLYAIGIAIKGTKLNNAIIPFVIGAAAVALSMLWVYSTSDIESGKALASAIFTGFVQGIMCAAASVYADQLIKQGKQLQ